MRNDIQEFLLNRPLSFKLSKEDLEGRTVKKWQDEFGEQEWIKTLLPGGLLMMSPQGFNIGTYREVLPLMQTACDVEGNHDAMLQAYKLATFFGNGKKAEQYLTKFAARDEAQPIHDAPALQPARWRPMTASRGSSSRCATAWAQKRCACSGLRLKSNRDSPASRRRNGAARREAKFRSLSLQSCAISPARPPTRMAIKIRRWRIYASILA